MDAWVDLEKIWVDLGRIDLTRIDLTRIDLVRDDFERWPESLGKKFLQPDLPSFDNRNAYTVVSWKRALGRSTLQVCQRRGVGALSTVSAFRHERAPTSCLQRLEAPEANNWTQNNVQRNHQRLRSRVLTAHNTPNCTMWRWAYCSSRLVSRLPWGCSPH